jgi:Restriction endonuclease
MANLKPLQMDLLDDVLQMGGGYVLNFSNQTFAEFFREELGIDIDDPKYSVMGGSKGKRMRYFLQNAPRPLVAKALNILWEYREAAMERTGELESIPDVHRKMAALLRSIGGTWNHQPANETPSHEALNQKVSPDTVEALRSRFMALLNVEPHKRGYDFERFLKDLFNAYGLESRDPFRIRGEQIDGSFQLQGATYLLEAKWQNPMVDAEDLRAFHGKVEEKAAWSRGLFVSYSGFSENGLFAFGRGKKVICMDGRDIYEALSHSIPLDKVIIEKARQAASRGPIFVRVSDMLELLAECR